jgi:hypothetical protein
MPAEGSERVGVLVVSVRLDERAGDVVAHLTAIDQLDAPPRAIAVAGDEVLTRVNEWLSAVTQGDSLSW